MVLLLLLSDRELRVFLFFCCQVPIDLILTRVLLVILRYVLLFQASHPGKRKGTMTSLIYHFQRGTLLKNVPHTVMAITKPISRHEDGAPIIVSDLFIAR